VHKPVPPLTLRAEDGEALIARVQQSNLPRADAETVEWVIRLCFAVVCALQEATCSVKRLRALLGGLRPTPAPPPEASAASPHTAGPGPHASAVRAADAEAAAMVAHTLPGEVQPPERAQPKGGHRPGTGRLGAAAYGGATRVECRHDELAVGQRCPVCGQGTLYPLPAGVEIRIDGNALLSARHYAREKLRCSACGAFLRRSCLRA
jgi:hypothetical protein